MSNTGQPTTDAINRESLSKPLEERYNDATVLSPAAGNSKDAGAPVFAHTDAINAGDKDFTTQQGPAGIRNDARSNILYTFDKSGTDDWLKVVRYAPSGRR